MFKILTVVFDGSPALVAESNMCSTGDQEVTGLIPMGFGNILKWKLIIK